MLNKHMLSGEKLMWGITGQVWMWVLDDITESLLIFKMLTIVSFHSKFDETLQLNVWYSHSAGQGNVQNISPQVFSCLVGYERAFSFQSFLDFTFVDKGEWASINSVVLPL